MAVAFALATESSDDIRAAARTLACRLSACMWIVWALLIGPIASADPGTGIGYVTAGGGVASRPVAVGNYLYVSTGTTVAAWDLTSSAPQIPSRTDAAPEPGEINDLVASPSGAYLYATTQTWSPAPDIALNGGGITVFSLSDPAHPTVVGRIPLGDSVFGYTSIPHLAAVGSGVLYVLDQYTGVFVYDISDESNPQFASGGPELGNLLTVFNIGTSAQVVGDNLYVGGYQPTESGDYLSVAVLDVSAPLVPTYLGIQNLVQVAELNAFVITPDGYGIVYGVSLEVFDARDPTNIVDVYRGDYPRENIAATAGVLHGDYLYVTTEPNCPIFEGCDGPLQLGIDVIDVSNRAAPTVVATAPIDLSPSGHSQAADTPFGPVVVSAGNYVSVLSLADPALPTVATNLPLVTSASTFATTATKAVFDAQGFAYLVGGSHGFSIIDPQTLSPVGRYDSVVNGVYSPGLSDIAVQGTTAYLVDVNGFSIVDVSDRAAPVAFGHLDLPAQETIAKVVVQGTTAYVSTWSTLRVVDVSNPATPTVVGTFDGFYVVSGLAVRGTTVFVAAQSAALGVNSPYFLWLIDVSNPAQPTQLWQGGECTDTVYTASERLAVSDDGTRAYLGGARDCDYAAIYDTSTPTAPTLLGTYTPEGPDGNLVNEVVLAGTRLYVASGVGVDLVDVSNPAAPVEIDHYAPLPSSAATLSRSAGGYLMFFSFVEDGISVFREDAVFTSGFE